MFHLLYTVYNSRFTLGGNETGDCGGAGKAGPRAGSVYSEGACWEEMTSC